MAVLQVLQSFAQSFELWVAHMLAHASGQLESDFLGFFLGIGIAQHSFEQVGVQVIADGSDVDVFVTELDSLRAKSVPEQPAGSGRGLERLVNLSQPTKVFLHRGQQGIRRQGLPDACQHTEVCRESVAHVVVWDAFLRGDKTFVARQRAIDAGEVSKTLPHRCRQLMDHLRDVWNRLLNALFIELQRLCHVIKNAQIVDNSKQPVLDDTRRSVG